MKKTKHPIKTLNTTLEKAPTGIKGLDEIINGGLPKGRVSLICGGPGCGKTLLADAIDTIGAKRVVLDTIETIPTLVRKLPLPERRVIGDLANAEKTILGLDLRPIHPGKVLS